MARLINNTVSTETAIKMITHFEDNSSVEKMLRVGDEVSDLRYIQDEELYMVSGIINKIGTRITKVTSVKTKKPTDNFAKDVAFKNMVVDSSEHYASNLVSVPITEIVEDSGTTEVTKIDFIPYPIVKMDMVYTDETTKNVELVVGDVLDEFIAIVGKKQVTGTFKIAAMYYTCPKSLPDIVGLYLTPIGGGDAFKVDFKDVISFEKKASTVVLDDSSLKSITTALNNSEDGEVFATLGTDVTIPPRADGKITTTMINSGKTLNLDLAGHSITTQAYAFYVNGGTLNISDSTNSGVISCTANGNAYPAVFVATGGTCNMSGGVIDTTNVEVTEDKPNWLYGVACSGDGIFNMTGGTMVIGGAAGISITNGTASGQGAQFTIGGDAKITGETCCAVYLADNKSVVIKDKAVINGGIIARMGDISVEDNAVVNGFGVNDDVYPLGKLVTVSGCSSMDAPILALTGCYNSSLGNDLNINIAKTAKVKGYRTNAVDIAMIDTKYDQTVTVNIEDAKNITIPESGLVWNIYDHDALAAMATEQGKTLPAKAATTTLTVTVAGEQVYPEPVEEEETVEEPEEETTVEENTETQDGDNEVDDEI